MKIGDYVKECRKCHCRWFKREDMYALHKDTNAEISVTMRYVCLNCGTPAYVKEVKLND